MLYDLCESLSETKEVPVEVKSRMMESFTIIHQSFSHDNEKIAFCFSGGKDSTILLDLVLSYIKFFQIKNRLEIYHIDTDYEFKEITDFIRKIEELWNLNIIHIHSESKDKGIKEIFHKGIEKMFIANRAIDNRKSHFSLHIHKRKHIEKICPLINWSFYDVWQYIDSLNVPYCKMYNEGYSSIGNRINSRPNEALYDHKTSSYVHARYLLHWQEERKFHHRSNYYKKELKRSNSLD